VLKNNIAGISAYWEHPLGTSTRQNDTIVLPFKGTYTIIFIKTDISGDTELKKTIEVTKLDTSVDPAWTFLTGANGAGKTWVWTSADIAWGGGEFLDEFWEEGFDIHSIPADEPDFWEEYFDFWDEEDADFFGWFGRGADSEMKFSFAGGAKFELTIDDGVKKSDVFVLNTKDKTLSNLSKTPFIWSPWTAWQDPEDPDTDDAEIRDWYDLGEYSEISQYDILRISEHELVVSFEVWYDDGEWSKRFIWFFEAK
jgi:hypothetical protein